VVGLLLIDVAVFSLFAMNRLTLIPLFADQVLHAGASGFGFLMASMGLGALVGALTLAFFPGLGANPARQFWLGLLWVAALLVFSFSRVFLLSSAALFVAGYSQISFVATANSRIQTLTPDGLRGRVMGLYAQALIGVGPLGAMQAGALATLLGAPWAMAVGATVAGAEVVADDREHLVELRPTAGRGDERGQRGLHDRRSDRAGDARDITRGRSCGKP